MRREEKVSFARVLRGRQTDVEKLLWSKLRSKRLNGHKFRRQEPIGVYIVDFVCFERKLVIELDGAQHNSDEGRHSDLQRTEWLKSQGFTLLRFWNNEVNNNLDGILQVIHIALTRALSHEGERVKRKRTHL